MLNGLKSAVQSIAARFAGRNRHVMARYDAASTTVNNRRHWADADALSANAAASPAVRRTLRMRARHEVANNSYAAGIVQTLANDTIGTGPRLQCNTQDPVGNAFLEREFWNWAKASRLADKLRIMRMARSQDGEAFAMLTNNPALGTRVQMDLRLIEADQVSSAWLSPMFDPLAVDGIVFDRHGNPVEYHVLKSHPGDYYSVGSLVGGYDKVPASDMLHFFKSLRPGQARGIPELTPALSLFAMMRDYSMATLDAAKAAAYVSGVVYSTAASVIDADDVTPSAKTELEINRNTWMTLPAGWEIGQVKAEQPTGTYAEFKREILNEIARCFNMPFNVAAGNSSGYNYASGRLDHQVYYKALRVEQSSIATQILDRVFAAWLNEAVLIEGYLPQQLRLVGEIPHQWFWDGVEHVDPAKEANAQETRLRNHTTTLADEYAKKGQDWETQIRQRAKEIALLNSLGLTPVPAGDDAQIVQEVVENE